MSTIQTKSLAAEVWRWNALVKILDFMTPLTAKMMAMGKEPQVQHLKKNSAQKSALATRREKVADGIKRDA